MSGVKDSQNLLRKDAQHALTHFSGHLPELRDVCVIERLDLRSIEVSGPVKVYNCVFEEAVDATDARFGRSVSFINCTFERGLSLAHARIDGPLDLSGSVLKPMAGGAKMPLHDLQVKGCVQGYRLQVECGLNFSDLECGSAFRLHGASIAGDLLLNSAYIEGEFDLSDCESTHGEAAARTIISGVLNCECAHIESRVLLIGTRLGSARFEQAHIEGTMFLGPGRYTPNQVELGVAVEAGKTADGCSLSLLGALLEGSLEVRGAKLHGALRVSNAEIGCYLLLTDASLDPNAPGTSKIPTSLGTSNGGVALRVTSTSIQGAMILGNVEFGGALDASNSSVSLFEIEELCVTNLKTLFARLPADERHEGVLALEGFTFGELSLIEAGKPKKEPSAHDFLHLLALTKFDEGTYVNVETWLRRSAKDDAADEVFRKMRKEEASRRLRWWKRFLYAPFGFLYGYGTRNRWACLIWITTFILSCCMFWDGSGLEHTGNIIQTPVVQIKPDWVDKIGVVFRIHMPVIPWFSDPEWSPSSNVFWHFIRYDIVAHALRMWNFINVTMIVASISGILKRRGS